MFKKDQDCHFYAEKYFSFIEIHLDDQRRQGFNTSQLIHYTLEPNPDHDTDDNAPQKLALAFSTADVVILGSRLGWLAERLRENHLGGVRPRANCQREPDSNQPFVVSIKITPIEKHITETHAV